MKPKVEESYLRGGVYATIKGARTFEVRPDDNSERYVLLGPGHRSVHPGYYEAVKAGLPLAEKAIDPSHPIEKIV